ncbi:hypothetical protein Theam_0560 [Thermovibrio ammonificans HB-1]|uniref:Uncharacterized protein n=1 Tax=Thermovibrio ammonificans (strain DSM 15698 / JCM 12110 / HB-1) TaxID=648996 RepID=E8T5Q7_THEA1|nr:hypothetical protein Theam_0560 [Thermovibrio ammonificans HB-1]
MKRLTAALIAALLGFTAPSCCLHRCCNCPCHRCR